MEAASRQSLHTNKHLVLLHSFVHVHNTMECKGGFAVAHELLCYKGS